MSGQLYIAPAIIAKAWLVLLEAEKARREEQRATASAEAKQ